MVARPAGGLGPVPAPATAAPPTPFADVAQDLRGRGLAPIPLGGDDGKVPLVKWRNLRWRHSRETLGRFVDNHPTANVGVLTGLSNVTVVDIDDVELVDAMAQAFSMGKVRRRNYRIRQECS